MKLFAPSFYGDFHCIAARCRHTCCAGWEIDVDQAAYARYQALPGPMGERVRQALCPPDGDESAHFRLLAFDRCPMLNENGLCDLITACGEDMLCQICADHPRFRSFFTARTEIGLGLCCEEAARLTLGQQAPWTLQCLEDDGQMEDMDEEEAALLALRERLFALLCDRTKPLPKRLEQMEGLLPPPDTARTLPQWAEALLPLERLDESWGAHLRRLRAKKCAPPFPAEMETPLEQLCACLLYRHLPGALCDGRYIQRIRLCILLTRMAAALYALQETRDFDALCELVRLMSGEIEYSQENLDALLDAL